VQIVGMVGVSDKDGMGAEQPPGAASEPCGWGKSHVPVRFCAEQTAAADALQRPLRPRFRQQVSASVTPHKVERPASEEEVLETDAHHRHSLRRPRSASGS